MMMTRAASDQGPGDLDQLALSRRQIRRRAVPASTSRPTRSQQAARAAVSMVPPIQPAEPAAPPPLAAQEQVGGHAQVFRQVQLLVDQDDAARAGRLRHAGQAQGAPSSSSSPASGV